MKNKILGKTVLKLFLKWERLFSNLMSTKPWLSKAWLMKMFKEPYNMEIPRNQKVSFPWFMKFQVSEVHLLLLSNGSGFQPSVPASLSRGWCLRQAMKWEKFWGHKLSLDSIRDRSRAHVALPAAASQPSRVKHAPPPPHHQGLPGSEVYQQFPQVLGGAGRLRNPGV